MAPVGHWMKISCDEPACRRESSLPSSWATCTPRGTNTPPAIERLKASGAMTKNEVRRSRGEKEDGREMTSVAEQPSWVGRTKLGKTLLRRPSSSTPVLLLYRHGTVAAPGPTPGHGPPKDTGTCVFHLGIFSATHAVWKAKAS